MTDDPTQMEVDLSDDATLEEIDGDTDEPAPRGEPPEPRTDEPEQPQGGEVPPKLREEAKQEAIRLRENADGETQSEKVSNAYQQAIDSYERNSQQLQQLKQQRQQSEDRIERLEMTRDRVLDQPEDVPILQTLAGGISLEVPPYQPETEDDDPAYDRDDLVDEIDETIEALEGQLEQLSGQEGSLEQALTKTQLAAQRLKEVTDVLEGGDQL